MDLLYNETGKKSNRSKGFEGKMIKAVRRTSRNAYEAIHNLNEAPSPRKKL
jgi:hypothetical protein